MATKEFDMGRSLRGTLKDSLKDAQQFYDIRDASERASNWMARLIGPSEKPASNKADFIQPRRWSDMDNPENTAVSQEGALNSAAPEAATTVISGPAVQTGSMPESLTLGEALSIAAQQSIDDEGRPVTGFVQKDSPTLEQASERAAANADNAAYLKRLHDERIKRAVEEESGVFKAFCRGNIRWLMAEMDHTREGRSEVERASLNP